LPKHLNHWRGRSGQVNVPAAHSGWGQRPMLVEKGETFQILAENIPVGLALINVEGEYRYLNPKFREMFGWDLADIPDGKAWFEKAYPDPEYRKSVVETWIKDFELFKPGEKKPWVFRVSCKDGSVKTIHFMPVQLASGEILMAYEDITQLATAREALEENETKLRLLYEKSVDPIFIFDGKDYIDCNEAAVRIMGCASKEELLKYHPLEITPEFQPDGELSRVKGTRMMERAMREGSNRFEWVREGFLGGDIGDNDPFRRHEATHVCSLARHNGTEEDRKGAQGQRGALPKHVR